MTARIEEQMGDSPLTQELLLPTLNRLWRPLLLKVLRKMNAMVVTTDSGGAFALPALDGLMHVVLARTAAAAVDVTLPAEFVDGDIVVIKDADGNAAANAVVFRVPAGSSARIDGSSSLNMFVNRGSVTLVAGSGHWHMI